MLCGKDVQRYNESALSSVLADVKFIEDEIRRLERPALDKVLEEVKLVSYSCLFRGTKADTSRQ